MGLPITWKWTDTYELYKSFQQRVEEDYSALKMFKGTLEERKKMLPFIPSNVFIVVKYT